MRSLVSKTEDKTSKIDPSLFTKREYEIIALIAKGLSNREISNQLFISEGTIANYISSNLGKTGLNSLVIFTFSKSSDSESAIETLLISLSCMISGCFFPIDIMPATVRRISAFLPQHWLLDTFNKLQQGSSMSSLYMNLLILLAFALTFSLLAIYKFRRNNDTRIFI
jgi:DNA-binding CsgD family transcriptional regulator